MKKIKTNEQIKFGQFLFELRKEKSLSQGQVGIMLGVTNKAVSKWENGDNKPEVAMLHKISDIYGVSMDELMDGERKKKLSDEEIEITNVALKKRLFEVENNFYRTTRTYFIVKLFLSTCVTFFFLFAFFSLLHFTSFNTKNPVSEFFLELLIFLAIPFFLVGLITGLQLIQKYIGRINPSIIMVLLTILPFTLTFVEALGLIFSLPIMLKEYRLVYPKDKHFSPSIHHFAFLSLSIYGIIFLVHILAIILWYIVFTKSILLTFIVLTIISLFIFIATFTIIVGFKARNLDLI